MNDAGTDDAAPADPVYSYRPSLFGAPWELRLTPSTLDWQFGRRAGRVPYAQIRKVRLSFRPAGMQYKRFQTDIWSKDNPKLIISSTTWKSMVEQTRQDSGYRDFVAELHRRLAPASAAAEFLGGVSPFLFWPGIGIFAVVAFGLAALVVRALQAQSYSGAAFVGVFLLLFLWRLGDYFRRNRPCRYQPDRPPAELMP